MTLPNGTTISAGQVRNEYGMGNPVSFSQFRGKGNVPGGGPVSLSQLWGASAVSFSPPGGSVGNQGSGSAQSTLSCSTTATWTWTDPGTAGFSASIGNGQAAGSVTFTQVSPGAGTRTANFQVTANANGITRTWDVQLDALGTA